ncbi:hypothetical protein Q7P37_005517 [Cladosporium fusiforme]
MERQFNISASRSKGQYMVANVDIARATRIIAESPLIWVRTKLRNNMYKDDTFFSPGDSSGAGLVMDQFNKLSAEQQNIYNRLVKTSKTAGELEEQKGNRSHALTEAAWDCLSRCQTNCFPVPNDENSPGEENDLVVFETISRINHSCKPNAFFSWNPATQQGVVQAIQRIPKGTQITLNYCSSIEDTLKSRVARREHLKSNWNFNCDCATCKGGPTADTARAAARQAHTELKALQNEFDEGLHDDVEGATCDEAHEPQRRLLDFYQNVINMFKNLGILDQKLSEIYRLKTAHHEARFNLNEHTSYKLCRHCQLLIHPCAHIDAAIEACDAMVNIDKICLGIDHPDVASGAAKCERLRNQRFSVVSPKRYFCLAEYNTRCSGAGSTEDTQAQCEECELLIHKGEHLDKAIDAYSAIMCIGIRSLEGVIPEVKSNEDARFQSASTTIHVHAFMDDAGEHQDWKNDMIRCNPSQIHLTSADVGDFDRRIASRQRAFSDVSKGKARLSVAPRLPRIITDSSVAARRASTATLHVSISPDTETSESLTHSLPGIEQAAVQLQTRLARSGDLAITPHQEPVKTDQLKLSPLSDPRLNLPRPQTEHHLHLRHRRRQTSPSHHRLPGLDGAHDHDVSGLQEPATRLQRNKPILAGREVFRELPGGSSPATSPQGISRLVNNTQAPSDSAIEHGQRTEPHRPSPTSSRQPRDEIGRAAPPRVVVLDDRDTGTAHIFDPGALPFTPRVRFGSTTVLSDAEQPNPALSPRSNEPALRVQSPSQENSNSRRESHAQSRPERSQTHNRTSTLPAEPYPRRPRSNAIVSRPRRPSENTSLPLPSPNLDRYPLLLPNGGSGGSGRNAFDRGSRVSSREHESRNTSPRQAQQQDLSSGAAHIPHTPPADMNLLHPSSPITSTSNHSSPDLGLPKATPIVYKRNSSLLWAENSPQPSESSRVPSIVSAASGISSIFVSDHPYAAQHCSPQTTDAAAEFLKSRPSPLDGLTAELSRLSTALNSHATSLGENIEAPESTRRVRLLSGTIFDRNHGSYEKEHEPKFEDYIDLSPMSCIHDREASSMRLFASPSRMTMTGLPIQPSTPNLHSTEPSFQGGVSPQHPPSQPHTATLDTTMPVSKTPITATPKVSVYNDATPSHLQPQTPADLHRTNRRARNRSDSSVHRQAFCVGLILVASRPKIPERRAYRNTYPTNAPGRATYPDPNNDPTSMPSDLSPVLDFGRSERATSSQSSGSEERENEVAAQFANLESERMVWLRRRQGGSLDVTPPREGRFERFLD